VGPWAGLQCSAGLIMRRPKSLLEASLRINDGISGGKDAYSWLAHHMSDFLHERKVRDVEWVRQAIEEDPAPITEVIDVWLGGFAEYLAQRHGLPVPAWTEAPSRFLSETFHLCSKSLFMAGLVKTPEAWARRKLICEEPDL
jgi:hypothetical protein